MLSEQKRTKIIALLANGSSRRVAARYVGCAPSTITRMARRDPEFARQLAAAEENTEIEALRNIREAARKGRHWKAAAWLLERKNPGDFQKLDPNYITQEQFVQCMKTIVECLIDDVPEPYIQRAKKKIETLSIELHEDYLEFPRPRPRMAKRRIRPRLPKLKMQHPASETDQVTTTTSNANPNPESTSAVQQ